MKVADTTLDLSVLPRQARQELVDFYEFLGMVQLGAEIG